MRISKVRKMRNKLLYLILLQSTLHRSGATNWLDDTYMHEHADMLDWSKHPCRRPCKDDGPIMECRYVFNVEYYSTMSKACYDCPRNYTDCFRPHCIPAEGTERSVVVANRQMPGPAIEVCEGDRIFVNVVNQLRSESTSIHWHGLNMRYTPYMDGTPYVTQCPILPGNSFQYAFIAENPGTYFWHSHVGFQRGDGLAGPLIVRQVPRRNHHEKLYDFDEHTIFITDWDRKTSLDKFLAYHHGSGGVDAVVPKNLLVNGLGRIGPELKYNGTSIHELTAVFTVKRKFRYRFRIVGAGTENCPVTVSIDNHTLLVISSDGNDVEPLRVKSLVIYSGERFDVVVEMDQKVDNYWIRFGGLVLCKLKYTQNANQLAILRYEGAPDADPRGEYSYDSPPKEDLLKQMNSLDKGTESTDTLSVIQLNSVNQDSPANTKNPDHQFYLSFDLYLEDVDEFNRPNLYGVKQVGPRYQVESPLINGIIYKKSPFPLLPQRELIEPGMFCNENTVKNCQNKVCTCNHVLEVELGSIVELVLVFEGLSGNTNHPFHLHGHNFRVVAMEKLAENITRRDVEKLDREGKIHRKLDRAPIKDTVTVPDAGYTIIRFEANNPGYWLFHCHIDMHSETGMALVFKVGEHKDMPPVPRGFPSCGNYEAQLPKTSSTQKPTQPTKKPKSSPLKNLISLISNATWKFVTLLLKKT